MIFQLLATLGTLLCACKKGVMYSTCSFQRAGWNWTIRLRGRVTRKQSLSFYKYQSLKVQLAFFSADLSLRGSFQKISVRAGMLKSFFLFARSTSYFQLYFFSFFSLYSTRHYEAGGYLKIHQDFRGVALQTLWLWAESHTSQVRT